MIDEVVRDTYPEKEWTTPDEETASSARSEGERDLPLSFAQERLWFLEQLEPGTPVYNIPWAVRLSGDLSIAILQQALDSIIARHEVLRTTYAAVDGVPQQGTNPPTPATMNVIDLRHLPSQERETTAQKQLNDEASRPFDITTDQMLRALLIRLTDDEQILLLVTHHIASDGWSNEILVRELSDLYQALSHDEEPKLPPLPMQYADYALWQRNRLSGEVLERELKYWKEQLADLPPALNLPFDRPRGSLPDYRGEQVPIEVPDQVTQGLRRLARKENVTLFMVLLTAFMTLLYRYTDEEDIPVGVPIAGRLRTDTDNLVGLFVNTLVLRSDLSQEPTFRQLLYRVRKVCLDAYDHQELPFEKLVAELRPERHMGQSPLFQVMFAMQSRVDEPTQLADLCMERTPVTTQTTKFDLLLSLTETPARIRGSMTFPIALFDTERAARITDNFQHLLESIIANPDRSIDTIQIMSDEEFNLITREWSRGMGASVHDNTIQALFEARVIESPDAPAVTSGDETLTYRELNRCANRVAHQLRQMGVGPDIPVGLCLERSNEMLVGILAILKAGGAYVPLDPALPLERLQFMASDADLRLVLTQAYLFSKLSPLSPELIAIDSAQTPASDADQQNPAQIAFPDNLAYIIYTSGSTGLPKGVLTSHRNVAARVSFFESVFGMRSDDVVLQLAPFTFDMSIRELICPVTIGAHIVMVTSAEAIDPFLLVKKIEKHRVTMIGGTPSFLTTIIDAIERTDGDYRSLRRILSSGEALSPPRARRILDTFGGSVRLSNEYGPTESTMNSTHYEVTRALPQHLHVPIGRPLPDTETYVLDRHLQPTPIGIAGELYIGGIGLARGYLNRPALTKEKFIPNPFSDEANARLYKTGDLARYLPDGNLEFLGRLDRQTKIRGYRIELGEIESALTSLPEVSQAIVDVFEPTHDDKRIVAYLIMATSEPRSPDALREKLRTRLPGYMIPSAFVILDRFPLTTRGKIDRAGLPDPASFHVDRTVEFVAPQTSAEELIARIWKDVLKSEQVSVYDDFFALGGHSLAAVQTIIRIRDETNVALPVRAMFELPTVRKLAAHLAGMLEAQELVQSRLQIKTLFEYPTIAQLAPPICPSPKNAEDAFLLHVQQAGNRPPFFFMADAKMLSSLSRQLGPKQPLYGLRVPGLGGDEVPLESIEKMAAYCIRAIETISKDGPYMIGGHCFGAIIALEMAHQLQERGKPASKLVITDPTPLTPIKRRRLLFWTYRIIFNIRHHRVRTAIRNRLRQMRSWIGARLYKGRAFKFHQFQKVRSNAWKQYRPRPYSGDILFLWPSEPIAPSWAYKRNIQREEWLRLAADSYREATITGQHTTIFLEPGITSVADRLRDEFAVAERTGSE